MVQLSILSGKKAGATCVARRFPVRIGRGAESDLRFEEDGVWEQHLVLDLEAGDGFVLRSQAGALTRLNGESIVQARLRNGDVIEMGALRFRFWLGETRQVGLRWREGLTWGAMALLTLGQAALLVWLLRL